MRTPTKGSIGTYFAIPRGQNTEFASARTIYDMIQGRFPGVEVSGTSIKILGTSSLNVSTEPTFVVDGERFFLLVKNHHEQ